MGVVQRPVPLAQSGGRPDRLMDVAPRPGHGVTHRHSLGQAGRRRRRQGASRAVGIGSVGPRVLEDLDDFPVNW